MKIDDAHYASASGFVLLIVVAALLGFLLWPVADDHADWLNPSAASDAIGRILYDRD